MLEARAQEFNKFLARISHLALTGSLVKLNSRRFVKFVSKVFADGHRLIFRPFTRTTFNPWA
jgi:hypothetical protein